MANIVAGQASQPSSLTVRNATGRSRGLPAATEECVPDPNEFRVGSLHVPWRDATAGPASGFRIGTDK